MHLKENSQKTCPLKKKNNGNRDPDIISSILTSITQDDGPFG